MAKSVLQATHHPDCYPSGESAALDFFREALQSENRLKLPQSAGRDLTGIIVPHIDFRVSMTAYAAAFRPLLETPLAETYFILGVGHRSRLEWNLDHRDYVTPLGRAVCATELVNRLAEGWSSAKIYGPQAHVGEHSIEFALLWLQALHRLHSSGSARPFRFVPILCGALHDYVEGVKEWDELNDLHRIASVLASILEDDEGAGKVRVIVSIDGCHLGPRFHHPFRVTPELLKATAGWEQLLWTRAEQGNARLFLEWMRGEGNDRYFDGVGALALLQAAGKGKLQMQRTHYEQWFTERDASAVTFSSGRIYGSGGARTAAVQ